MAVDIINNQNQQDSKQGTSASTTTVAAAPGSSTSAFGSSAPAAGQAVSTPTDIGSGNAPSGPSGGGAAPTAAAAQATRTTPAPTAQTGTGFVNLQNILQANRQNTLGQQVGSGIQQQTQNVQSNLQQIGQNVQQQMQQGEIGSAADQSAASGILSNIAGYTAPTTTPTSGATAPTTGPAAGLSQTDISTMQRLLSGQYTGPSVSDINQMYTPVQQQAMTAEQLANVTNTPGGLQALTQQFVGPSAGYTSGQSALDALLLSQTGGGQLAAARQSALGLQNQVTNALQGTTQQVGAAQQASQDFSNQLKSQIAANQADVLNQAIQSYNTAVANDTATQQQYAELQHMLTPTGRNLQVILPGTQQPTPITNFLTQLSQGVSSGTIPNVTPDQLAQIQTLATQGYVQNPTGSSGIMNPLYKEIPTYFDSPTGPWRNPDTGQIIWGKLPTQWLNTATGQITWTPPMLSNQQAVDQGLKQYSNVSTLSPYIPGGLAQLLGTDLTLTKEKGYTPSTTTGTTPTPQNIGAAQAFIDPTMAAKLNALAQISGQTSSPLTSNIPTYTPASMSFNINDVLQKIAAAEQQASGQPV